MNEPDDPADPPAVDVTHSDLKELTPKDLLHGIIKTYAEVYLKEHEVQTFAVTDREIVLVADDDLIVDFFMTKEGYGHGDSWTYVIQELTPNKLFTYNHSAFRNIFREACICMVSVKYEGVPVCDGEFNHFLKVNQLLPELHLKERCSSLPGEPYAFVIVKMDHADGGVGYGIGYTGKDARSLLVKICKNLETANPYYLDKKGLPGLMIEHSQDFFHAFQSWKGGSKLKRLQEHLQYYVIEKMIRKKDELHSIPREIMNGIKAGQYDTVSWNTYDDIGRRAKK